jgi:hypothetical protein
MDRIEAVKVLEQLKESITTTNGKSDLPEAEIAFTLAIETLKRIEVEKIKSAIYSLMFENRIDISIKEQSTISQAIVSYLEDK